MSLRSPREDEIQISVMPARIAGHPGLLKESTALKSIELAESFVAFACFVVRPYCLVSSVS